MPPAYCDLIFRVSLHTNKKCYKPQKRFIAFWSEWRDSNSRHPGPKPGALPTGPHPDRTPRGCRGDNTKILYRIFMGNASKICCISRAAGNCAKPAHMGENPRLPEGRRTSVRFVRPRTEGGWTFPKIPAFHKYSCGNPDICGNSRRPSRRSAAPAVR